MFQRSGLLEHESYTTARERNRHGRQCRAADLLPVASLSPLFRWLAQKQVNITETLLLAARSTSEEVKGYTPPGVGLYPLQILC